MCVCSKVQARDLGATQPWRPSLYHLSISTCFMCALLLSVLPPLTSPCLFIRSGGALSAVSVLLILMVMPAKLLPSRLAPGSDL